MKKKLYHKYYKSEEDDFLYSVAEDYECVANIVSIIAPDLRGTPYKRAMPSKKQFLRTLAFIAYLFKKYGKHLSYSIGAGGRPIDKTPAELLAWLKQQWETGKYKDIDYGVWFELEESVIPLHYMPALDPKFNKHTGTWDSLHNYYKIAWKLEDSPVGGDIMGFESKQGWLFRFNKQTGEFLARHALDYVVTLFRPKEGLNYYLKQLELYGNG
jgi:hypothetical protein